MRVVTLTDATSVATTCNVCFKVLASKNKMKQHMKDTNHGPETSTCNVCFKVFASQTGMNCHMKAKHMDSKHMNSKHVLEPRIPGMKRDVACPLCRVKKFKSSCGAVSHVESGSCTSCQGKDKARQTVFDFVCAKKGARGLLAKPLQLQFAGSPAGGARGPVPDSPYRCAECGKTFEKVSGMMQHQKAKHGNSSTLKAMGF